MSSELETGLPSIRFIQKLIREGKEVEVQMLTSEKLFGKIQWQDNECLCLSDQAEQKSLLWREAIAYIKPKS